MLEPDLPPVVSARDVSIRYLSRRGGGLAVRGATFDIADGEILAVVGESGSGKSALAATIAMQGNGSSTGSPVISGGSLTVLGISLRDKNPRRLERLGMRVGYLPQNAGAALSPRLTVGENVAEPIFSRDPKFSTRAAGIAVATLIDAVRLPLGTMNKFPYELSNGQRQRVAIARALILEPTLFIADDPTAGIDVVVRPVILDIIRTLQRDRAFSALVVTGELGEISRITDRVLVMQGGVVVGRGEIAHVLENPQHPYTASLAKSMVLGIPLEAMSVD